MNLYESTFNTLHQIYDKHRRNYPENSDSAQMCCMWSTDDPPDIIADTEPFIDIEAAFKIVIDEDEALLLYDMDLKDAAKRIVALKFAPK